MEYFKSHLKDLQRTKCGQRNPTTSKTHLILSHQWPRRTLLQNPEPSLNLESLHSLRVLRGTTVTTVIRRVTWSSSVLGGRGLRGVSLSRGTRICTMGYMSLFLGGV